MASIILYIHTMTPYIVVTHTSTFIESLLMDNNIEVGHFSIHFGTTYHMGIGIDQAYQGKGYSIQLIQAVRNNIDLPKDKKLYIDTDASEGFWNNLGLVPNPLYDFTEEQRDLEGAGYEKYIVFEELLKKIT